MQDLRDYLHLYIGISSQFKIRNTGRMFTRPLEASDIDHFFNDDFYMFIKPVLRPLADMKVEEEKKYLEKIPFTGHIIGEARRTLYLLKQGFDLFGLIDDELAIDMTEL